MSWAYLDNRADKVGAWADAKPGVAAIYAKIPQAIGVPAPILARSVRATAAVPRARRLSRFHSFTLPGNWLSIEVASPDGSKVAGQVVRGIGESVWTGMEFVPPGRYLIRAEAAAGGGAAEGSTPAQGAFLLVAP
jgi:hypothetical protein